MGTCNWRAWLFSAWSDAARSVSRLAANLDLLHRAEVAAQGKFLINRLMLGCWGLEPIATARTQAASNAPLHISWPGSTSPGRRGSPSRDGCCGSRHLAPSASIIVITRRASGRLHCKRSVEDVSCGRLPVCVRHRAQNFGVRDVG